MLVDGRRGRFTWTSTQTGPPASGWEVELWLIRGCRARMCLSVFPSAQRFLSVDGDGFCLWDPEGMSHTRNWPELT